MNSGTDFFVTSFTSFGSLLIGTQTFKILRYRPKLAYETGWYINKLPCVQLITEWVEGGH